MESFDIPNKIDEVALKLSEDLVVLPKKLGKSVVYLLSALRRSAAPEGGCSLDGPSCC